MSTWNLCCVCVHACQFFWMTTFLHRQCFSILCFPNHHNFFQKIHFWWLCGLPKMPPFDTKSPQNSNPKICMLMWACCFCTIPQGFSARHLFCVQFHAKLKKISKIFQGNEKWHKMVFFWHFRSFFGHKSHFCAMNDHEEVIVVLKWPICASSNFWRHCGATQWKVFVTQFFACSCQFVKMWVIFTICVEFVQNPTRHTHICTQLHVMVAILKNPKKACLCSFFLTFQTCSLPFCATLLLFLFFAKS